eukprot:TRINITY_DN3125_c2_g1_i1.p1 TRINITY_DN3125_c2_g1~~TRINITY_DN3125_c2_g1_i1.p1  ORF type:complete len:1879 (+),score=415.43 TRINITY_DN3125_c2_g1_i1:148-5784(+)
MAVPTYAAAVGSPVVLLASPPPPMSPAAPRRAASLQPPCLVVRRAPSAERLLHAASPGSPPPAEACSPPRPAQLRPCSSWAAPSPAARQAMTAAVGGLSMQTARSSGSLQVPCGRASPASPGSPRLLGSPCPAMPAVSPSAPLIGRGRVLSRSPTPLSPRPASVCGMISRSPTPLAHPLAEPVVIMRLPSRSSTPIPMSPLLAEPMASSGSPVSVQLMPTPVAAVSVGRLPSPAPSSPPVSRILTAVSSEPSSFVPIATAAFSPTSSPPRLPTSAPQSWQFGQQHEIHQQQQQQQSRQQSGLLQHTDYVPMSPPPIASFPPSSGKQSGPQAPSHASWPKAKASSPPLPAEPDIVGGQMAVKSAVQSKGSSPFLSGSTRDSQTCRDSTTPSTPMLEAAAARAHEHVQEAVARLGHVESLASSCKEAHLGKLADKASEHRFRPAVSWYGTTSERECVVLDSSTESGMTAPPVRDPGHARNQGSADAALLRDQEARDAAPNLEDPTPRNALALAVPPGRGRFALEDVSPRNDLRLRQKSAPSQAGQPEPFCLQQTFEASCGEAVPTGSTTWPGDGQRPASPMPRDVQKAIVEVMQPSQHTGRPFDLAHGARASVQARKQTQTPPLATSYSSRSSGRSASKQACIGDAKSAQRSASKASSRGNAQTPVQDTRKKMPTTSSSSCLANAAGPVRLSSSPSAAVASDAAAKVGEESDEEAEALASALWSAAGGITEIVPNGPPGKTRWLRLAIVSSRVKNPPLLLKAIKGDVGAVLFDWAKASPESLLEDCRRALGKGNRVASVSLMTHIKAGAVCLTRGMRTTCGSLACLPRLRQFWRTLATEFLASGGRIDLLACGPTAGSSHADACQENRALEKELTAMTGLKVRTCVSVGTSCGTALGGRKPTAAGKLGQMSTSLYFEADKIRSWFDSAGNAHKTGVQAQQKMLELEDLPRSDRTRRKEPLSCKESSSKGENVDDKQTSTAAAPVRDGEGSQRRSDDTCDTQTTPTEAKPAPIQDPSLLEMAAAASSCAQPAREPHPLPAGVEEYEALAFAMQLYDHTLRDFNASWQQAYCARIAETLDCDRVDIVRMRGCRLDCGGSAVLLETIVVGFPTQAALEQAAALLSASVAGTNGQAAAACVLDGQLWGRHQLRKQPERTRKRHAASPWLAEQQAVLQRDASSHMSLVGTSKLPESHAAGPAPGAQAELPGGGETQPRQSAAAVQGAASAAAAPGHQSPSVADADASWLAAEQMEAEASRQQDLAVLEAKDAGCSPSAAHHRCASGQDALLTTEHGCQTGGREPPAATGSKQDANTRPAVLSTIEAFARIEQPMETGTDPARRATCPDEEKPTQPRDAPESAGAAFVLPEEQSWSGRPVSESTRPSSTRASSGANSEDAVTEEPTRCASELAAMQTGPKAAPPVQQPVSAAATAAAGCNKPPVHDACLEQACAKDDDPAASSLQTPLPSNTGGLHAEAEDCHMASQQEAANATLSSTLGGWQPQSLPTCSELVPVKEVPTLAETAIASATLTAAKSSSEATSGPAPYRGPPRSVSPHRVLARSPMSRTGDDSQRPPRLPSSPSKVASPCPAALPDACAQPALSSTADPYSLSPVREQAAAAAARRDDADALALREVLEELQRVRTAEASVQRLVHEEEQLCELTACSFQKTREVSKAECRSHEDELGNAWTESAALREELKKAERELEEAEEAREKRHALELEEHALQAELLRLAEDCVRLATEKEDAALEKELQEEQSAADALDNFWAEHEVRLAQAQSEASESRTAWVQKAKRLHAFIEQGHGEQRELEAQSEKMQQLINDDEAAIANHAYSNLQECQDYEMFEEKEIERLRSVIEERRAELGAEEEQASESRSRISSRHPAS